jgi:E2/UBC family protein E
LVRRDFQLPNADELYLEFTCLDWETVKEGSQWFLLHRYPIPEGYNHASASLALQIPPSYPDVQIDMAFFYPAIERADGLAVAATHAKRKIDGKEWQQWSRHRTPQEPWRPGVDCLALHIALVHYWLEREFDKD